MRNKYSKLNLNQSLLKDCLIDIVGEANFDIKHISKSQKKISITVPGLGIAFLIVYFNNDGTTSITWKTGKFPEESHKFAEKITQKCEMKELSRNQFTIAGITEDTFAIIREFLEEEKCDIHEGKGIPSGKQYIITGIQGDSISAILYNNGRLHIQGKALLTFTQTVSILSEIIDDARALINLQLETFSVSISHDEIIREYESKLVASKTFLDPKIKKILCASLIIEKMDVEMGDYTAIAFPALRGLEGFMKQLFSKHRIIIPKEGFGTVFNGEKLNDKTRELIICETTCTALEHCYVYYKTQRHSLFHVDGIVSTTRIIDNKSSAEDVITKVFNMIEESYTNIIS